tara:strand:- start:278 stop:538 length:261 start_codon:yes stop_codon:yes gene_type:complete
MIQGIIIKKILDAVMKLIFKKYNLDKITAYVEKPNDLDKQMKQVQKNLSKALQYIEVLEKNVGTLKASSHTPIEGLEKRLKKLEKK